MDIDCCDFLKLSGLVVVVGGVLGWLCVVFMLVVVLFMVIGG